MRTLLVTTSLLLALAGCATARPALKPGVPTTLAPGERLTLPDAGTLTYVGVSSDSRCPPKVLCIQAGSATVAFRHEADGRSHDVTVQSPEAPTADLGAWRLTLVSLTFDAPPRAAIRIDPAR